MVIAALMVSIVAAAVWYARGSARSAQTAAAAAEKTAALDGERRHAELTPQFEIACTAGESSIGDYGELRVTLTGPPGLDRLDEVTIVILDESGVDHWGHGYPTGVSEDEARGFVWGPWEFNTGASARSPATGLPGRGRTPGPMARTGTASAWCAPGPVAG